MKFKLIIIFIFTNLIRISAVNYYLSAMGNDSNDGLTVNTPWKTITKLNGAWSRVVPGDSILFRRGDIFRGMIQPTANGSADAPCVIGAYGVGANPVISGSKVVSTWTLHSGKIWKADLTGFSANTIESIYSNSVLLEPAREPNNMYYTTTVDGTTTTITSFDLTQPTGYWNGATLVHRVRNWVWDKATVQSSSYNQLVISSSTPLLFASQSGRGFYFTNKLSYIDTENEWFFDPTTKMMYVWFPGGINPSSNIVEVPVYENRYGILLNTKYYWTIENLTFTQGHWGGIRGNSSSFLTIRNCIFENNSGVGIRINVGDYIKIQNNTIRNVINTGIVVNNSRFYEISNNKILKCGLPTSYIDGYDRHGISVGTGFKGKICYNQIDTVGSSGISLSDSLTVIEKNIINNSCYKISDNGGIYLVNAGKSVSTTGIYGDSIRNNFIYNTIGNYEGANRSTLVQGMDISDYAGNCVIENNTVYNNEEYGIKLFGAFSNKVKNNVLFGNKEAQLGIGTKSSLFSESVVKNNVISNNLMACNNDIQVSMKVFSDYNTYDFGTYDYNNYFNPFGKYSCELSYGSSTTSYASSYLSRWRVLQPLNNQHSTEVTPSLQSFTENSTVGNNLITNGNFDSNVNGWSNLLGSNWINSGGINGGTYQIGGASTGMLNLYSNSFSVIKDKTYRLRFSCKSARFAKVVVKIAKQYNGDAYSQEKYFELKTSVSDYSYIFKATATAADASVLFLTTDDDIQFTYYLDNVDLYEVNATPVDNNDQIRLFTNPSNSVLTISGVNETFTDINSNLTKSSFQIDPWSSKVMLINKTPLATIEKNAESYSVRIYPNPASEFIQIDNFQSNFISCEIYDANGRMLIAKKLEASSNVIAVSVLPKGFYCIRLISADGRQNKNKVLIKN